MRYLPFENIIYETELEPEEVLKRINGIVEPKKNFRNTGLLGNNSHKPYEGNVYGNIFNINRIIRYRNAFLPRIKGTIEKGTGLTIVKVKMNLHPFVLVFMFIWCGGVVLPFSALLLLSIKNGIFDPAILILLLMLLLGCGLTIAGFKYESIKSKHYLAELFEAEIK